VGEKTEANKVMTGLVNRVVLTGMIRSACELADLGFDY
jgi:hypothetical protein